jgi:hypothetical protein
VQADFAMPNKERRETVTVPSTGVVECITLNSRLLHWRHIKRFVKQLRQRACSNIAAGYIEVAVMNTTRHPNPTLLQQFLSDSDLSAKKLLFESEMNFDEV